MVIQERRCIHCKKQYTYQASGCPQKEYSHSHLYCQDCSKIIKKALSKVPVKRDKVYVENKEVTKEMIEQWDKECNEWCEKNNAARLRFVYVPSFIMSTGEMQRIIEVTGRDGEFRGRHFILSYFNSELPKYEVEEVMEKDLETGKIIGPWRYI